MIPLSNDVIALLRQQISSLNQGVYCEINYQTSSGKKRTVKGTFMGVENEKAILVQNNRKNKVPLDHIYWWTYSIADQGEKIEWPIKSFT